MVNMLIAALLLLATNWKSTTLPLVEEWISQVRYVFLMGKLSAVCRYRMGQEKAIELFPFQWSVFVELKYVNSCHVSIRE